MNKQKFRRSKLRITKNRKYSKRPLFTKKIKNTFPFIPTIIFFLFLLFLVLTIKKPQIALLSFEIEPIDGKESVLNILNLLNDHNKESKIINVTFFITGQYVERFPSVVKKIHKAGYEIGCHTYSHPFMNRISIERKTREILKCSDLIEKHTGTRPVGFRAPWNRIDKDTLFLLNKFSYKYDASVINNLQIFYPNSIKYDLIEIPVSNFNLIPLNDVIWLNFAPKTYFFILKHKKDSVLSYSFHPNHIYKEKDSLNMLITELKNRNVKFISHEEYASWHGEW